MTETANTATQPGSKNTAEPSEPTREQLLEGLDDFAKTTLERMEGWAQEYNNNDVTISAAKGDVQGLLQKLRETSSNPEVKEITKQIERIDDARFALDQKRDELLKPEADKLKAEATANSSSLEESNKDLKSKFNTARKFFADLVEDETLSVLSFPSSPVPLVGRAQVLVLAFAVSVSAIGRLSRARPLRSSITLLLQLSSLVSTRLRSRSCSSLLQVVTTLLSGLTRLASPFLLRTVLTTRSSLVTPRALRRPPLLKRLLLLRLLILRLALPLMLRRVRKVESRRVSDPTILTP